MKSDFEVFTDGILCICSAKERNIDKTKVKNVHFGIRTVGIQRFWAAKTAGNDVNMLISIPLEILHVALVSANDVILIETGHRQGQYKVLQVQEKWDTKPPSIYLSLEKLVHPYKDRRET